jgi:hypothetical protein
MIALTVERVRERWPTIVEEAAKMSRQLAASIESISIDAIYDDIVLISYPPGPKTPRYRRAHHFELVHIATHKVLGVRLTLRIVPHIPPLETDLRSQ